MRSVYSMAAMLAASSASSFDMVPMAAPADRHGKAFNWHRHGRYSPADVRALGAERGVGRPPAVLRKRMERARQAEGTR